MTKKTRVLIVEDSATMRGLVKSVLVKDPTIEVVGGAADPYEAREAIKALSPDVITLDVEMPRMSGIAFLERIMRLRPMPVIMVSSLTDAGAATAIEALEMGAFAAIGKPSDGNIADAFAKLPELVAAAASARVGMTPKRSALKSLPANFDPGDSVVAIGSSTGGVEALQLLLSSFPERCPPTVITQHMPEAFTATFARRLDSLVAPRVKEAEHGEPLKPGYVYIAPGGKRHLEVSGKRALSVSLVDSGPVSGHRPSVDVLFRSVARSCAPRAVGAILTGMGRDGADGLLAMRHSGSQTIGQDCDTCVVYGMPKAAFENGAVEEVLPIQDIGHAILSRCGQRPTRMAAMG